MGELVKVESNIAKYGGGGSVMPSAEDLVSMRSVAQIFVDAGMFEVSAKEAEKGITPEKKLAQAQVKIMAGAEMGIGPWAAIKGMHLVKGKCVPGYQILLSKVRMCPGYDYKVHQWDREAARIEFFRNGQSLGVSKFDVKDMQQAGLGGDMYSKFMNLMFVARATSNGINVLCPEVLNGATASTPADFGYVEGEDGELIEVDVTPQAKEPAKQIKKLAATGDAPAMKAPAKKEEVKVEVKSEPAPEPEPAPQAQAQEAETVEVEPEPTTTTTNTETGEVQQAAPAEKKRSRGWDND